ncbi:MAG: VanW family protein [Clostridiales bacterium]|jgi:vancomycin resistance protein YoaR|nr:VanW family protein [Clostridiales bacterium]
MKRWFSFLVAAALLASAMAAAPALAASYVSAETPLGSSSARISNIRLAADAINGYFLPYGETFSFNDVVGARTAKRGYQSALNGRGVKVVGGGVAQVASTLYLALQQLDGISYDEFKTYGSRYNQSYVDDAADAVLVDEESGIDFAFTNYRDDMTIEAYTSGDSLYVTLNFDASSGSNGAAGTLVGSAAIYVSGTQALFNNVDLAAQAVNGIQLGSNDTFSFNDSVGARTKARGYQSAVNGRGSKVTGGGVGQVASAVWLAVKYLDDVSIVEKSTYGSKYNQDYVGSASDAILVDYDAGTDFSFRFTGDGTLTIYAYLNGDTLVCEVYRTESSSGSWEDDSESEGWWW